VTLRLRRRTDTDIRQRRSTSFWRMAALRNLIEQTAASLDIILEGALVISPG